MKLPRLAMENYQFSCVVFLLLLFLGINSFINMPRTEDPPVTPPGATIIVVYPGTNPIDMEKLVTEPVENSLNELDDIDKLKSTIGDGISATYISFDYGTDPERKYDSVVRQINSIRQQLPENIFKLEIIKWTTTDVAIVELALVSSQSEVRLVSDVGDELKKKLEKIEGVKKVELHAVRNQQVKVSVDLEKLAQMGLSFQRVSDAIRSSNANIPGGMIKISGKKFNVQTSGSYGELGDIRNTILNSDEGRIIYLKDVASVEFEYEEANHFVRHNGTSGILLTVQQKPRTNIFNVTEQITKTVKDFKSTLNKELEIYQVLNQAESVDERINGFFENLLQGVILVGICIMLIFGFRSSLLVMTAIPGSFIIGIGFVHLSGYGLQQVSIGGLVIALGLLVDNSIVVVENIERYLDMGFSRIDAACKATSEVGWAVASGTITTCMAFIPIISMPDRSGEFLRSLPVTVVFTLISSFFIAVTITPILGSMILEKQKKNKEEGKKKLRLVPALIQLIIEGPYRKLLNLALKFRILVVILSISILGYSFSIFSKVGLSFFPAAEKPQFVVQITMPEGTNIDRTDEIAREVEKIILEHPQTKSCTTSTGKGNPKIYYNFTPKQYKQNFAEMFVQLKSYTPESFSQTLDNLRTQLKKNLTADIAVREFQQGPSSSAPLEVVIKGDDIEILKEFADKTEQVIASIAGPINIENSSGKTRTDIRFFINREKANMFGIPVHIIDQTIRTCISGSTISIFRDSQGDQFDIVLSLAGSEYFSLDDLYKIQVKSISGESIPLSQIAEIGFEGAPGQINREDLDRRSSVTAFIASGYNLDKIAEQVELKLDSIKWPEGYSWYFGGKLEQRGSSFGSMGNAMIIALLGIFSVLVLQFRSFVKPVIIFSAIPMAMVGSIWALYITGYSFSLMAFLGIISLVGIVVNDSIVLVEFISMQSEDSSNTVDEAIRLAGEIRFIPIIITTLTTIGGLLPLTLFGGIMWAAMGWTIIGGMITSTFLTLILVPVLYSLLVRDADIS